MRGGYSEGGLVVLLYRIVGLDRVTCGTSFSLKLSMILKLTHKFYPALPGISRTTSRRLAPFSARSSRCSSYSSTCATTTRASLRTTRTS